MKTSDLVFVGIKGSVVALERATGNQRWATHLKGWNFVNVVLQNDAILASCQGEIFCLDPFTGNALWHNPLKGFGTGLATIAGDFNQVSASAAVLSEERRRDEAAASAATM
ncbi:MAG TPA: PQQ-binding-like beta-propeller repeat protein [Verrucomicrobiae bacterium]|jgi:outer membrane protein assembly factor BamB|nr:PQQ-binding-like beta-propeller repeat protein [Verrucomicrobiae bacterium]